MGTALFGAQVPILEYVFPTKGLVAATLLEAIGFASNSTKTLG